MPPVVLLLFALFALIAIVAAVMGSKAANQRRDELIALAHQFGLSFYPGHDPDHDDHYSHFEIFRRGHSRSAYNTIAGMLEEHDSPFSTAMYVRMGDFQYKVTTNNGKTTTTTTYRFSYLIVHIPFAHCPNLLIRREGVFDWIKGALGFNDIDFESAEFSKRFYVSSSDRKFAYDVITPLMMEFLMSHDAPTVDIERARVCISNGRTRWQPAEFGQRLDWLFRFLDLWPEHVRVELAQRNTMHPDHQMLEEPR
ncbi:MAG: hypothetical protein H6815_01800 [Phycisphaeraceae bacterium]|nr:hypothetical protein [Phycisphaerales bacterium]MCB9859162.1 hypothetical protein [Phycisphaeraceae bacterium]